MILVYAVLLLSLVVLVAIMCGMAIRDIRADKTTPTWHTNIILPYLPFPSTFHELATTYMIIANAPFAQAREGFRQPVNTALYPTLYKKPAKQRSLTDTIYDSICRIIAVAHISVFIACFGLAVLVHEPIFIAAYLGCFSVWIMWTVGRYPHMAPAQKVTLIILLPSMAGYFFYRLAASPVRKSRITA